MGQTKRLQVSVSEELFNDISTYAKSIGVSHSVLCAVLLRQSIDANARKPKNEIERVGEEIDG